jgi:hypothetical protein
MHERRKDMGEWLSKIEGELREIRTELHGTNGRGLWQLAKDTEVKVDKLVKQTGDQERRITATEDTTARGKVSARWWAVFAMLFLTMAFTGLSTFL